jgi:hypothetical protein
MDPIDTTQKNQFYLPPMSPFNGMLSPIDSLIQHTIYTINGLDPQVRKNMLIQILQNLNNNDITQDIIYEAQNILCLNHEENYIDSPHEEKNKSVSDEDQNDDDEKFKSISDEEENQNDDDDDDDDDELNNNIEANNIIKPLPITNFTAIMKEQINSNNNDIIETNLEDNFMIGKITKLVNEKATITLEDGRVGSFPDKFRYFGELNDYVKVFIKFENKTKLILNLINKIFKKDEVVEGTIHISGNITYVNIPGIKRATLPQNYIHNLKTGTKISCKIYETYNFTKEDKIIGISAKVSFNSTI